MFKRVLGGTMMITAALAAATTAATAAVTGRKSLHLQAQQQQQQQAVVVQQQQQQQAFVLPGWPSYGHFIAWPGTIDIRMRDSYIVAYDRRTKNAVWVAQHVIAKQLAITSGDGGGDRRNSDFKEDASILPQYRSTNQDYFRSGYDRGHLCPAADSKTSQKAMDATFLLTNISPQVGDGFNRDYWARMEQFARNMVTSFGEAWIISGPMYIPVYDPQTKKHFVHYECIGENKVAVPTHFFKVIMVPRGEGKFAIGAFVLPNQHIADNTPLKSFVYPVEEVERLTGLHFMQTPIEFAGMKSPAAPAAALPSPSSTKQNNIVAIEELCNTASCTLPPGYKGGGKRKEKED